MVEAAGQLIRIFRCGLDYAFTRFLGRGACYPVNLATRILVPARPSKLGEPMSLYRAALRLARLLPLGVAMPLPILRKCRQGSPM